MGLSLRRLNTLSHAKVPRASSPILMRQVQQSDKSNLSVEQRSTFLSLGATLAILFIIVAFKTEQRRCSSHTAPLAKMAQACDFLLAFLSSPNSMQKNLQTSLCGMPVTPADELVAERRPMMLINLFDAPQRAATLQLGRSQPWIKLGEASYIRPCLPPS